MKSEPAFYIECMNLYAQPASNGGLSRFPFPVFLAEKCCDLAGPRAATGCDDLLLVSGYCFLFCKSKFMPDEPFIMDDRHIWKYVTSREIMIIFQRRSADSINVQCTVPVLC
jgi:hypothetical protein